MDASSVWSDVDAVRAKKPLVHNITNYVVMNSTANALLALGASPVMAHAREEVEDMVGLTAALGGALVINIGTLSREWIVSMEAAMKAAAQRGVPMVLDPVGAGATPFRTATCARLLEAARPTVIRGNASEIMALFQSGIQTKGVDSSLGAEAAAEGAKQLAQRFACVVSVSGAVDMITDGQEMVWIKQGHPLMTQVTGLGCTASALTGAFLAVNPYPLRAAAHAMAVMGICGEIAAKKAQGPGTLQLYFYDALYQLSEEQIAGYMR